ncbi:response regulator receiver protein [Hyphomicrobium denitrificans 1NES1]|uniref:Response regulator receiver protein n=1 Tax=Hyphomicrobium denitrificans 1NES1 TaxID=670307 RepID=N0BCZ0_9HYPH|nr:response regulator [Hyphomicrobium denitrificans]AGK57980.1 response regulator receiver protein [Hyphomicrobium denitrificans 1NES1]
MDVKQATEMGRAGTILFVDDEPLSLKYFKASVGKYANVVTADTPEAALKILQSEGDAISVVVSDERMPRDSGVSFLSDVRKSWPSTVRILTSAYANIDLQQAINGAAIHRFVPKPWDLDELCAAMQEALHVEPANNETAALSCGNDQRSDAHNASLELLAVLTRELARPLESLESEALKISTLTGMQPMLQMLCGTSQAAAWPARYREGKLAAAANQIHRDVEYCKALAEPIAALSESLSDLVGTVSYSMAETASETLDKIGRRSSGKLIELDARNDFQYRIPKQVVTFVLSNLLQSATERLQGNRSGIAIALVPGSDCNEVRITIAKTERADGTAHNVERINRSALWAFGGELLFSSDNVQGSETASICLPRVQSEAARSSH